MIRRKKNKNIFVIPKNFTIGSVITLIAILIYQGTQLLIIEQKSNLQDNEVTTCFTPPS